VWQDDSYNEHSVLCQVRILLVVKSAYWTQASRHTRLVRGRSEAACLHWLRQLTTTGYIGIKTDRLRAVGYYGLGLNKLGRKELLRFSCNSLKGLLLNYLQNNRIGEAKFSGATSPGNPCFYGDV